MPFAPVHSYARHPVQLQARKDGRVSNASPEKEGEDGARAHGVAARAAERGCGLADDLSERGIEPRVRCITTVSIDDASRMADACVRAKQLE